MMLTIREVTQRTGISRDAIYTRIASGEIKAEHKGNKYLIPEEELSKLPKPRNTGHAARSKSKQQANTQETSTVHAKVNMEPTSIEKLVKAARMLDILSNMYDALQTGAQSNLFQHASKGRSRTETLRDFSNEELEEVLELVTRRAFASAETGNVNYERLLEIFEEVQETGTTDEKIIAATVLSTPLMYLLLEWLSSSLNSTQEHDTEEIKVPQKPIQQYG
jgi:excisionase family DNA binding protein